MQDSRISIHRIVIVGETHCVSSLCASSAHLKHEFSEVTAVIASSE